MHDPIWTTSTGQQLKVGQMTDSHLTNSVAKIERSRTGWRAAWLPRLRLELDIRRMGLRSG